ncbi:biogenesis of lysosome-related organelles complex 1 subunit 4-like [Mytilus edulis]|uniref:biogenesis of lysosome-related organelles complex 1 subunit 4-like n=1 Tax=Mytilus edulis TaxID=6550 RepID=UPI0039F09BB9
MKMEVENVEKLNPEETEENNDPSSKLVEDLAIEYSQYMKIDTEAEYGKFFTTVEEMLTKLEEFGQLVELVRSDTAICMNDAMPLIQNKCNEMHTVFDKIDNLEKFVLLVKDNVSVMETELVKAEDQMGSFSGLKKMLSSFVSPKKTQTKVTKQADYEVPIIFKTEDYLQTKHSKDIKQEPNKDSEQK